MDIKICGLKTPEIVAAVINQGASHIGFIFFPKSPRHVQPEVAATLAQAARGKAKIVAVTVDADDALLEDIVSTLKPDILQLHGHESVARVQTVKERYGVPVIKAFSVREAADLDAALAYVGVADRLLFDARAPKGSELPGGNGVSFDWTLLARLDGSIDYMLSGGLNAENVAAALAQTAPAGLDVSSGVESAPGVKDETRIAAFFEAVRKARI
ncbi:phosphoribosylanthranilate isomerase [Limoniibacter endophyticus]|uniref:N-(5'-phosphoribosyl)anthranilate isomerase n=1 Tax=Limoniibacter endophyticus TaxID=1565040 RepID=A0A8J3GGQ0_9HYPH|nr:phosphoribosylanthranilate isomerase [Limoniibacter endophyticus]GHC66931.1 N-(5'-phosphoribosyl)anthranilate isomerase [Limoniibacter endophyticus]